MVASNWSLWLSFDLVHPSHLEKDRVEVCSPGFLPYLFEEAFLVTRCEEENGRMDV